MRIISFFDWTGFAVRDIYELALLVLGDYFVSPASHYVAIGDKLFNAGSLNRMLAKMEANDGTVSSELYSAVKDESDPDASWEAYLSCSLREGGSKTCIIAFPDESFSDKQMIQSVEAVDSLGHIGYGFSMEFSGEGDDRYYAAGISTTYSTEEEMEEDSRWTIERLVMRGQIEAKNRHLKGYFKNVFEYNFITEKHVNNIRKVLGKSVAANEIYKLNNTYVWKPLYSRLQEYKGKLEECGFLI